MVHFETPLPDTCQAWVWEGSASPLDLSLQQRALHPLQTGEVWVRNRAIGLNPVDWKVMGGDLLGWQPGKVPGVDGAGIVAAIGPGVAPDWLGKSVAYHQSLARPGSFAEYTPVAAQVLVPMPAQLDFENAAGFPCPGLTAWQAIDKIPVHPGAALLISGAGGSVGQYLVQYAVARGFQVTVLCSTRHWERMRALGVHDCCNQPEALEDRQFHAVIDCVSTARAAQLVPCLESNGHLVCIQGRLADWPSPPFQRAISMHEVALGATHQFGSAAAWAALTAQGTSLLEQIVHHTLQPDALVVREFNALPQLLEALRQRNFSGKPVIRL